MPPSYELSIIDPRRHGGFAGRRVPGLDLPVPYPYSREPDIFRFVLYEYISGKSLPEGFDEKLIQSGVKQRSPGTAVL